MNLKLDREPSAHDCTLGRLYVNGVFFCDTLEDVIREIPGKPVSEWKVKGKTAIPQGGYPIQITYSPKYKRLMPLVDEVPGFVGIRIHSGNTDEDTEGCILVGKRQLPDKVIESRITFGKLFDVLQAAWIAGETIGILIVNPTVQVAAFGIAEE